MMSYFFDSIFQSITIMDKKKANITRDKSVTRRHLDILNYLFLLFIYRISYFD